MESVFSPFNQADAASLDGFIQAAGSATAGGIVLMTSSHGIGDESTAGREFVHSRLIDAPQEKVFQAFADPHRTVTRKENPP